MKVIYMGKNKPIVRKGLDYLMNKGFDICDVIIPSDKPLVKNYELELIQKFKEIDLVISFLFPNKIKKPLIEHPRIGCINFHPAPLPEFKGYAPYTFGIMEEVDYWGVSAHVVDEEFDTGDIIKVNKFKIDPKKETAYSLEQKSQYFLLKLFEEVVDEIYEKKVLSRTPQKKRGRYYSKIDFENLRQIAPEDTIELLEKKVRAFWCPPWPGVEYKGFTLVNRQILNIIADKC